MDAFKDYVMLDKSAEVMEHTRSIISNYIPSMQESKDYGIDFYKAVDKAAKRLPIIETLSGKCFDSLRDLAEYIANEYEATMSAPAGKAKDWEADLLKNDPEAYLAVTCGM